MYELSQRLRGLYKPRPLRSCRTCILRSCRTCIHDLGTREIQDQISREVYWVAPPVGPGPAASISIIDDEVMRFDCFGIDIGHYHFNVRQSKYFPNGEKTRIFFPEGTWNSRSKTRPCNCGANWDYGRGLNTDPRIRAVKIDQIAVGEAAEWMRDQLLEIAAVERDFKPAVC